MNLKDRRSKRFILKMFKCERGDAPPFCRRDEKKRVLRTDLGGVGGATTAGDVCGVKRFGSL